MKILVVDDECNELVCFFNKLLRGENEFELIPQSDPQITLQKIEDLTPDIILLDLVFNGEDPMDGLGFVVLSEIQKMRFTEFIPAVVVKTQHSRNFDIIEKAHDHGCLFFLGQDVMSTKENVIPTFRAACEWTRKEKARREKWKQRKEHDVQLPKETIKIVGAHHKMQQVYDLIEEAAKQNLPVMIYGESGTGKELVSKAIHYHADSLRRDNPFVAHNMAVMSTDRGLIISELFGCPDNYPNSRDCASIGIFQKAMGLEYPTLVPGAKGANRLYPVKGSATPGTLFLDEIATMPYAVQTMLLRVLEEGKAEDLARQEYKLDVRLICATNQDLYSMSEEERFRMDLFNRLESGMIINLPTLNERLEGEDSDLKILLEHFLQKYNNQFYKQVRMILPSQEDLFRNCDWRNKNVRAFEHIVRDCVRISCGEILEISQRTRDFFNKHSMKKK